MASRPATQEQKRYAGWIASVLGLSLPSEDSAAAYSAFISESKDAYEDICHDWPTDDDDGSAFGNDPF